MRQCNIASRSLGRLPSLLLHAARANFVVLHLLYIALTPNAVAASAAAEAKTSHMGTMSVIARFRHSIDIYTVGPHHQGGVEHRCDRL